jgi:cytochrome P450
MALDLVSQTYTPDPGEGPPSQAPISDFTPPLDLTKSANFTSGLPFEAYREMRERAPIAWHPMKGSAGFWALTSYDLVRQANLDTKTFSSQAGGILAAYLDEARRHPLLHRASLDTMICLDAPHHMGLRREHMAWFTPGYVKRLRAKVEAYVATLMDDLAAAGPVCDLVSTVSEKLPLFTLCEILGIPEADRPKIAAWMEMLELAQYTLEQEELGNVDPAQIMTFLQEVQAMFDYGQAILQDRRANPREDLLSAIANAEVDGAKLADEYLDGSWLLIVFAGNDTTRNSISGTMRLLTEFPDAKAELIANPDLIPAMTHEAIRMVSPVIYMRRTATMDTELGGQTIAAGDKVIMFYGAANRDPSVFADPDTFDIHRTNAKEHLAFGIGPHVCLGQRVANMQLDVVYRQMLARFPSIRWTGEQDILPNSFTHSVGRLMVDLG